MIINKSGISIRMGLDDLRVMGRNTQGVRLIKLNDGDAISSVAKIEIEEAVVTDTIIPEDAAPDAPDNTNQEPETPETE